MLHEKKTPYEYVSSETNPNPTEYLFSQCLIPVFKYCMSVISKIYLRPFTNSEVTVIFR